MSPAAARKRQSEWFEVACEINGGSRNKENGQLPGQVGLCQTTVKNCSNKVLVEVFSRSNKISKKVLPKVYKKGLTDFEKSNVNMLRSIAVYYSGGVMGKRKYRATYRDSSYRKNNSKATRIVVNSCAIPRLVPYNKLMPYIKSIDIGKLYSVRETLCQGWQEEEKVDGMYRDIKELLVSLAKYYLCHSKYKLTCFQGQPYTFHVSRGGGGGGAPFGKDDTACAWLISFLNIGRGVLSSNENYLLFGANCKEDCVPVSRISRSW